MIRRSSAINCLLLAYTVSRAVRNKICKRRFDREGLNTHDSPGGCPVDDPVDSCSGARYVTMILI